MPFADLRDRLTEIRGRIDEAVKRGGHGQSVTLVAVTKTFGPEAVRAAHDAGIVDVGENKVQEAIGKQAQIDLSLRWHLIGHLQRNKVKALEHFHLFHALDSQRLAEAVSSWAVERNHRARVLMQVNVSGEATKGGFPANDVAAEAAHWRSLPGLEVIGAMTMAPFDVPERTVRECFAGARGALDALRAAGHPATELSMGMSGDFEIAVEEGATIVRLGTVLFGART